MKSVYSPSEKAIYPAYMYDDYEEAGTWPKDGIEISDEDAIKFNGSNQPTGKELGLVDGALAWVDLAAPTQEELVAEAVTKKTGLIADVNSHTKIWQTQLLLGMITDDDKAKLVVWMKYAQEVQAIDTSLAPDIVWPDVPKE